MAEKVDESRRRFLTTATTVVGGVGLAASAVPFAASWLPSARAQAAGAPIAVNVSKLEPGQQMTIEWRGKPIWIIRRTPESIAKLEQNIDQLRDPHSEVDQQPEYAKNKHRALKAEYLVLVGLCTHLGCVPSYKPNLSELGPDWPGGFFCPCHGSMFDLAGRVYKDVPAPINLEIPPYRFLGEHTIEIGVNPATESA